MKLLPFCLQNNSKKRAVYTGQKGFSLIEIIATLVILGILGVFVSTGITRVIKGYLFSKDNADTALKCQVAFARVLKEFRSIDAVQKGTKTSITYSYNRNGNSISGRSLYWAGSDGDPLLLKGRPLIDRVNSFKLTYYSGPDDKGNNSWNNKTDCLIGIVLKLKGASDHISTFSTRIMPRNRECP